MSRAPLTSVLLCLALVPVSTVVASSAEAAGAQASRRAPAPKLAPARTVAGEPVVLTGRLQVARRTPIRLERQVSGTWVRAARTTAAKGGKYRFRITTPAKRTAYRVVARSQPSRARVLTVIPQTGALTLPAPGTTAAATATFKPARPGRTVTLQQRDQGVWRSVAKTVQSTAGVARLPVPLDLEVPATYRAVAAPLRGAAAVTTAAATLAVRAVPARIVAPVADAAISGTVPVRIDPKGVTGVTRVAVFVGGSPLGDAAAQPDGTWLANVDTRELSNGRTDLTARVWTPRGSRLVPSVHVRVANDHSSTGSNVPDGFRIDTVVGGLSLPTSFAVVDEHRTLVIEKDGLVRLVVDGRLQAPPVLDLTDRVANWWDQGLIGIALDPDFATNGWFYLSYVLKRDAADELGDAVGDMGAQRVARYTMTGNVASPASEHVVLGGVRGPACFDHPATDDCIPIEGGSHTIDDLLFLPDGSLLVSVGDGEMNVHDRSGAMRSQDVDVLAGKVLRIDPLTGRGLSDNPLYETGDPGSNRSRVWAYGLRNPFRMTIGPDGEVYVADVGENAQEEIDRLEPGGNYGWPCLEGSDIENPMGLSGCDGILDGDVGVVDPLFVYNHFYVGSATGGVFYTGDSYPEQYRGRYFFGDYSYSVVWQIDLDEPSTFDFFANRPGAGGAVKFAIGPDGNVWYLSVTTGELRRIVYDPDGDTCPSDRFRGEWFDKPDPAPSDVPVLVTCETSIPTGDDFAVPPYVAGADGFSVRWTGHPALPGGTYALDTESEGTVEVTVDGEEVADGGTFHVTQTGVADATPEIVVTLAGAADHPGPHVAWSRTGAAPRVTIGGLLPGGLLAPGTSQGWTVSATTASGAAVPAADLVSTVTLLHYGSSAPHTHPSATVAGAAGQFTFAQDHGPGRTAFRIDARATAADGSVGVADPLYVCLVGNEVGPCGH